MKRIVLPAVFFVCCMFGLSGQLLAQDFEEQVAASRAAAKAFGMNLKSELQSAVKAGGPISGIAVCNEKAAQIAADTSRTQGLEVGRTSLKVRNLDNAPDGWELAVLERFEQRKAAGEPVSELEHYELLEVEGKQVFRYMKAIPTGKVCLVCHGETIDEELAVRLDELYPEDQARGFKEGDIRGAFTISKKPM